MNHNFNIQLAADFGVYESIFLTNLAFWTEHNIANRKNVRFGYCWSYNTIEAFTEIFSYFNKRQIEHLINKLVDKGLLAKAKLNKTKYDQTRWYALTAKSIIYFPALMKEQYMEILAKSEEDAKNLTDCESKSLINLISQKCEIVFSNLLDRIPKNVKPIPDKNTDLKPDTKSSCRHAPKKARSKKPVKTKAEWREENEVKPHWHDKVKVCEAVTEDKVVCGRCKRTTDWCTCNGLSPVAEKMYKILPMFAGKLTGKSALTKNGDQGNGRAQGCIKTMEAKDGEQQERI